jgi:plastocyanin
MKTNYLKSVVAIVAFSTSIQFTNAQAIVDIATSGSSFSPANVTVNIGDTVRWTNTGGTHNVNGTTGTFPSNPESFGNALGSGWVFKHKFTTVGDYDYRCDQHFGAGMVGIVTVVDPTAGLSNLTSDKVTISVYPIPASKELTIQVDQINELEGETFAIIYDLVGQEVSKQTIVSVKTTMNTSSLSNSAYILKIVNGNNVVDTRKVSFNN